MIIVSTCMLVISWALLDSLFLCAGLIIVTFVYEVDERVCSWSYILLYCFHPPCLGHLFTSTQCFVSALNSTVVNSLYPASDSTPTPPGVLQTLALPQTAALMGQNIMM